MYGLAIAAVLAVLLTLIASLTLLPALLSRFGPAWRAARARKGRSRRRPRRLPSTAPPATVTAPTGPLTAPPRSAWRRWSEIVRRVHGRLRSCSLAVMVALLVPVFAMRLDSSDAGNDPASTSSRHAFDLLAQGFGAGFNGPLLLVAELPRRDQTAALAALRAAVGATPGVVAVTQPRIAPSGDRRRDPGLPRLRAAGGRHDEPGQPSA